MTFQSCVSMLLSCACKQDTVIYERLEGDQSLKDVTCTHLEEFANIGWQHIALDLYFTFDMHFVLMLKVLC